MKYEVQFEKRPEWQVKDQKYVVEGHVNEEEDPLYVSLDSICVNEIGRIGYRWEEVEGDYGEAAATLEAEFGKYSECPREEQLGEIWSTFMGGMNL